VVEDSCYEGVVKEYGPCRFLRPTPQEVEAKVTACVKDGALVDGLKKGDSGMVILDITPFYAEMGGQVGDRGILKGKGGSFIVEDTKAPFSGIIAHLGKVTEGSVAVGNTLTATIDFERRRDTERNHTATHLLHLALHEILGEHAHQGGSLVCPEYFRFDFSHHKALTPEELIKIEERVNQLIAENVPVSDYELLLEEVQKRHDIRQFFGEKYGSVVRVLEVGPSKELCGGTHVMQTGSIGYFRIVKEYSIAAGIRRIEGVTSLKAVQEARTTDKAFETLSMILKVPPAKLEEKITRLVADNKDLEGEVKALRKERVKLHLSSLSLDDAKNVLFGVLSIGPSDLHVALDEASKSHPGCILVIGCVDGGKAHLSVKVPKEREAIHAGELLKEGLSFIGGVGGGKRETAQGAGNCPDKLLDAILAVVKKV
jgi:alanyl-tRNA synthetase